jgi:hypothetical protein
MSFPVEMNGAYEHLNAYRVIVQDDPDHNSETQRINSSEQPSLVNGVWTVTKTVTALSEAEIDDKFQQTIRPLEIAVSNALDSLAATMGYDNVIALCSYINSTNSTYKSEALYMNGLRDMVWEELYNITNAAKAGERTLPTEEELFAELPAISY